jgi:hypothetical protein
MSGDTNSGDADPDAADRGARFEPDAEKREALREIADDVRGESPESKQVAALLYRVSDLYDPGEDTDPRDIYVNMREILRVKERGGMDG